jgi:D-alanyl-D-alanine carboxypeptidase (penicillin-binding protein 5/6)
VKDQVRQDRRPARRSFLPAPVTAATLTAAVAVIALLAFVALLALGALLALPAQPAAAWPPGSKAALEVTPAFPQGEPKPPRITAHAAIVMDLESGAVFYARNPDEELPMASTTKIMTALLVLGSLDLDEEIKVPAAAIGVPGSNAGLRRGETLTVRQLLNALLVASGNDAAVTLAIAAKGSVDAFVRAMNEKARELGLLHTHFVNASGLHHEKHYSSARDLARLARLAMADPVFRQIVSTTQYDLGGGRLLKNSNPLLGEVPWINGIKTGSTPYADYCLVASGTKDGLTLISVILGAADDETRSAETMALLEYGFSVCPLTTIVDRGAVIAEIPVPDPLERRVRLVTDAPFTRRVLGPEKITASVVLAGEVRLPVEAGQVLGELRFKQGELKLGAVRLIAAQSVTKADIRMILAYWRTLWPPGLGLERWEATRPAAARPASR